MSRVIKACVDRVPSRDAFVSTAERAITENPTNVPIVRPGLGVAPPRRWELAALAGKKWRLGRLLRVRFLDGNSGVQAKVTRIAQEWTKYANVKLVFGADPDSEIRISFQEGGSWSWIGTDALNQPKDEQTMNFGWLTPETDDAEYGRVVLHEFGHALGCIHEHQNPSANIQWDRDAVYRYYAGPPNFWSKEQVDVNLFEKYDETVTQFSHFDPESIMLYPIPNEFTRDDFEVGMNGTLSLMDKQFISALYPMAKKELRELEVDGPPVESAIGKHAEEDEYRFVVGEWGLHRIETEGPTDVVMALFGPDTMKTKISEDDDSGRDRNARIEVPLKAGAYYVRIRHYRPTGTGKYSIVVRRIG